MIDLVCLAADKSIEATIEGLLRRPHALGIRSVRFETLVHPGHDPGCFHSPEELLGGYVDRADHALVVLDLDWDGAPGRNGVELEHHLEATLEGIGAPGWARPVVIEPELEAWVFSDSPLVPAALGWTESSRAFRTALESAGLWRTGEPKPNDPKRAMSWSLWRSGKPRSSSLFRELASRVGFQRCEDRSFLRLVEILQGWFASDPSSGTK